MEKRLGMIAVVISDKQIISEVNDLITTFSEFVIARQGIPMPQKSLSFISLIVEAPMNSFNTLTGKLGKLRGVEVKTIVTKQELIDKTE